MERTGLFISHAHGDGELASLLADLLKATLSLDDDNVTCTSDEEYGLDFGGGLSDQIKARLVRAQAVVLLATPAARSREWVQYECGVAAGERGRGLAFYVAIPSDAHRDVVPAPYQNDVSVCLSRVAEVQRFVRQIARDLKATTQERADAKMAAVVDFAHELALEDRSATLRAESEAREHALQKESETLRAELERSRSARSVATRWWIGFLAFALLVPTVTAFQYGRGRETRAREATERKMNDSLRAKDKEMKDSLDAKDKELSAKLREANDMAAEEFKAFGVSGMVFNRDYRPVPCDSVIAELDDKRTVVKACDASGSFSFLPSELRNDARIPLQLKVRMNRQDRFPHKPLLTLTAADLAVVLR